MDSGRNLLLAILHDCPVQPGPRRWRRVRHLLAERDTAIEQPLE